MSLYDDGSRGRGGEEKAGGRSGGGGGEHAGEGAWSFGSSPCRGSSGVQHDAWPSGKRERAADKACRKGRNGGGVMNVAYINQGMAWYW